MRLSRSSLPCQNPPRSRNAPLAEAHPVAVQASQQLACVLTQALPPFGALHAEVWLLVLHLVVPFALVRQHVTADGLPQVDFAAHLTTAP